MLRSRHVPALHRLYFDREKIFLVMERAGQHDLKQHLRETRCLAQVT